MKYIYEIIESKDAGSNKTYGIRVTENGRTVEEFSDIAMSQNAVSKLVGMCNENELYPIHLRDVIEDFLP